MHEGKIPLAAERWDKEYREGKYDRETPIPFVDDILSALTEKDMLGSRGMYVGCGNGRNYLPLIDSGLDLIGLDISQEAINQVGKVRPEIVGKLTVGNFIEYEPKALFDYLISIQVYQHGNFDEVTKYFEKTVDLLRSGGLFFLRVNSSTTEIFHNYKVVEGNVEDGMTIRYENGPKADLDIHFFSRNEIEALSESSFDIVAPLREISMSRTAPKDGKWVQWEGIWKKK